MNSDMMEALENIEREKGISVEIMLEALANALVTAYKRMPDAAEEALVEIDIETGDIKVIAQELDEDGNVVREWDDTPDDFGPHRRADRQAGDLAAHPRGRARDEVRGVRGPRGRHRHRDHPADRPALHALDLGKVEALLPQAEQVQNEHYDHGSRLKAYIVEVRKTAKGPQIVVSRTHPGLVKRLFELEVPEIVDGVVELKAIAREPGHRTKIAVASNDHNVDPVGACVGARGSRVRMVVNELRGEKVDIVPYSDDPSGVRDEGARPGARARGAHPPRHRHRRGDRPRLPAVARDRQGRPERPLAARLTGWRVDIKSETQLAEEEAGGGVEYAEGEWVTNDSGRAGVAAGRGRRDDLGRRGGLRRRARRPPPDAGRSPAARRCAAAGTAGWPAVARHARPDAATRPDEAEVANEEPPRVPEVSR